MRNTSRNNEVMKYCFGDDAEFVAVKHYERLQRELTEARKQRDALAEALRTASERFRNPKYGCMWDDAADDIDKTLSAVKGGSHE